MLHSDRPYSVFPEVETAVRRVIVCVNDSRDKHTVQAISVMSYWIYFVYSKSSSGNFSLYLHIRMIIHCRTEGD